MSWMSWYLGRVVVAAAIVGGRAARARRCCAAARCSRSRAIALLAPASAVYLWKPNISTDQIFVMRRFLFSRAPVVDRCSRSGSSPRCCGSCRSRYRARCRWSVARRSIACWRRRGTRSRRSRRCRNITEQRGDLLALRRTRARRSASNAAVVVLQSPTGLLYQWAPQPLRGWCNVPVAVHARRRCPIAAARSRSSRRSGRPRAATLWVVADTPDDDPGASLPAAHDDRARRW